MHTILMVTHILVAFALIGIILIQHGRGADTGAAFGSGASATVFGARGSATFLSRTTAILAIVFFSNSLFLAYLATQSAQERSVMDAVQDVAPAPAAGDTLPTTGAPPTDAPPAMDAAMPASDGPPADTASIPVEAPSASGAAADMPPPAN